MPSLIYFIESGDILNDNFNILKTMQTVAKTTQSKLDYDKTYRGYVISQNSNGKYKIKINGHIYENVDNPSGHTISSGDIVRVTFPQNNASQCYICMASQRDGVVSTVKSVNGKTGDVTLTQDDVPNGNTYVRTHNDFTTEDKGAISKNAQDIISLQQSKQNNITGGASSITSVNLGVNKALVSNASGKVATSNVTSTELSYLSGVTSNIQEQIDSKVPTSVLPSDDLPKADSGSGNAGKSEKYSRGDHVHPTDNSKLDKNNGEASNLLIIDGYTMVDQNGNKVDVSQIDGAIKFYSSGSDPNVVLKYVGDPVDEYGHIIVDFSIYDAYLAGFEEVIFVIKKENAEDFHNVIGNRIEKIMKVRYAFQELENLPEGFEVPAGRVKPWGTAHAILSCKDMIDGPFAVINADDYYGREAFKQIYDYLSVHEDNEKYQYAMVGYQLKNTLTENGSVARGVCEIDGAGKLVSVTEHTTIVKRGENAAYTEDDGKSYTCI